MAATVTDEFELRSTCKDGISAVRFGALANSLLVSSWDKTVSLYDVDANALKLQYEHSHAVLDTCFAPKDTHAFSGGLDKTVKSVDLHSASETVLGQHRDAVRCLRYCEDVGFLASGSWDQTVALWDPRSATSQVGTYNVLGKVYSMCIWKHLMVVASSQRHIYIYDVRNMSEPQQCRESSLKNQTRAVEAFPDGQGYVLCSTEGRVAVEYFDVSPEVQSQKYAFKCHRGKLEDGRTIVYPINAIAFHPVYGTFATAGDDGMVNIWDGSARKRIRQLRAYPTSISSLSFNHDGTKLAVASSYTFSQGERDHPTDSVYIRAMDSTEVMPKAKR